jgi:1-aminocyclopropane-1-carboxylate deaminase
MQCTIDQVSAFFETALDISVLRLDKIHPVISGNKWFKLRYYLEDAKAKGKKSILTFGGAWSNHIIATATAGKLNGFNTVGIIRGEEPAVLSPTLLNAKAEGMQLVFIPRTEYSEKNIPAAFRTDEHYIIHEGGYGELGAAGAATILDGLTETHTHICCAAGTGTTAAGIANAAKGRQIIAISVLRNNHSMQGMIESLLAPGTVAPELIHDYHFGGYSKYQPALLQFMNELYQHTQIPTDFVYTGKLFYAVRDLIQKNFFPSGSRILLIHSGGLQGNLSLRKGTLMF